MGLQIERDTDETQAVTTAETKIYIKANYGTDTDEDALITDLIFSAQRFLENMGNFSISSKTWKAWTDVPDQLRKLHLPCGPHISIQHIYRMDIEEAETELTLNTDYWKRGMSDYILTFTSSPSDGVPRGTVLNNYPIRVEFTAGFATVPDDLKIPVMKLVAENYINREDTSDIAIHVVPHDAIQMASVHFRNRL